MEKFFSSKKRIVTFLVFFMSFFSFCFAVTDVEQKITHTEKGTIYGEKGVSAYAESNHGPDGALFLDPFFKSDIQDINNKNILDAGCGAAPWSVYAAHNGGNVYAIDIQAGMIQTAKKIVRAAGLLKKIFLTEGDVAALPYKDNFFDKAISICVGCNLPEWSFKKHFIELRRTLKTDGIAIVGAPASLDVVFSNGSKTEAEVFSHIQEVLKQLPNNPSPEIIFEKLIQLNEVLSATFYIKDNRLSLVINEKDIKEGAKIWRKLPKLIVPNSYYSKDFYIKEIESNNFIIQKIDLPHFASESDRLKYNKKATFGAKLGSSYVLHAPFIIFHIKKK